MSEKKRNGLALVACLVIPFVAAGIGGAATATSVGSWYEGLQKPSWNPPGWLFGPVWTVLYLTMGIASWLVWRERKGSRSALTLYGSQLVLNAVWSVMFFGLRSPGMAFAEIIGLWGTLVATVVAFHRIRPLAAWMMVPYLLWTSFAAVLNGTLWWLNRS